MSKLNRREFSLGAVAAALATQAVAQPSEPKPRKPTPEEAGQQHSQEINRGKTALKGASAVSEEGLHALIDELVKLKLISSDDAGALHDMVKDLSNGKTIADIERAIKVALERKTGDLTKTIVNIVKSSYETARSWFKDIDVRKLRYVIANDTSGALQGAAAGTGIAAITGIGAAPAAIICAIVGASSTSLIASDDYKPS